MNLTGKHVAILGVGRSGRAAALLALREGARVSAWDLAGAEAFADMPPGVEIHPNATAEQGREVVSDLLVVSPGIDTYGPYRRRVRAQRRRSHRRSRTRGPFLSGKNHRHHRHQRQDHDHRTGGAHSLPTPDWAARPAATMARPSPKWCSRPIRRPPSRSSSARSSSKPSARSTRSWRSGSTSRRTTWTAIRPCRPTARRNCGFSRTKPRPTPRSSASGEDLPPLAARIVTFSTTDRAGGLVF